MSTFASTFVFPSLCQDAAPLVILNELMRQANLFRSEKLRRLYLEAYDRALDDWPVPYEARLVETRFGGTHVVSSGPAEGPPLLLRHGSGVSSTMWRPNVAALSARFRVHAVDTLWEVGRGAPARFPVGHEEANQWLDDVIESLGENRVDLVGLSYGGYLSLRFAIDRPKRVRRLVILSPAASFTDLSGKFFLNAIGAIIVPTRPAAIARRLTKWVAVTNVDDDLIEQWVAGLRALKLPAPIQKIPPLVFEDDELRRLKPPTLLLMGKGEWTCRDPRSAMERFDRLVPEGRSMMLADAGHLVSWDRAVEVNASILEHLGE